MNTFSFIYLYVIISIMHIIRVYGLDGVYRYLK